ncbi:MAG: thioredoxin family protein [Dehalococcoidales bacterium]|nr:thioredoxin family protein [Dehalococcoidales bacterium]
MEIIVIGTEPPCIRCQTTYKRAQEVAREYPFHIEVKKIAIHSPEAEKFGKVESGHGISEMTRVKPNFASMMKIMQELHELAKDEDKNEEIIDLKLKELENVLQPVKEKAREMGYLMTPVTVINGDIKSMDYVPGKDEIRAWIEIESRRKQP